MSEPQEILAKAAMERLTPVVNTLRRDGWDALLYVERQPEDDLTIEVRVRIKLANYPR